MPLQQWPQTSGGWFTFPEFPQSWLKDWDLENRHQLMTLPNPPQSASQWCAWSFLQFKSLSVVKFKGYLNKRINFPITFCLWTLMQWEFRAPMSWRLLCFLQQVMMAVAVISWFCRVDLPSIHPLTQAKSIHPFAAQNTISPTSCLFWQLQTNDCPANSPSVPEISALSMWKQYFSIYSDRVLFVKFTESLTKSCCDTPSKIIFNQFQQRSWDLLTTQCSVSLCILAGILTFHPPNTNHTVD